MSDRVSVVIPLYNKARHIRATLDAVMAQTAPPFEVIVINDGSTDGGAEIARGTPGVRVIDQLNAGVSAARNRGVAEAHGDLIAFLDADDRWEPGYLSAITQMAATFPDAGMYCTGYRTEAGGAPGAVYGIRDWHAGRIGVVDNFYGEWNRRSFTQTSCIAVRSEVLARAGGFVVGERLGEDQDMWFRVAELTPVVHRNEPLSNYILDAQNSTGGHFANVLPAYVRIAERVRAGLTPSGMAKAARRLYASHLINVARARAAAGDKRGARALLWSRPALANPVYWVRSVLAVK